MALLNVVNEGLFLDQRRVLPMREDVKVHCNALGYVCLIAVHDAIVARECSDYLVKRDWGERRQHLCAVLDSLLRYS